MKCFNNGIDISLSTTGSWTDIDLGSYIPGGATGVIILVRNTHSSYHYQFGLRKNGSTDDRYYYLASNNQIIFCIGIDSNKIVEGKISNTYIKFILLGYFQNDAYFFTNAYDKSISTTGAWTDIDCSGQIPSYGLAAIFELGNPSASGTYYIAIRKNGSTDNRYMARALWVTSAIIGVDNNRICEGYIANTDMKFFLNGYLYYGTFKTNGLDKSLSTTGSYQDIDMSSDNPPSYHDSVLVEIYNPSDTGQTFLRKDGSSDDYYSYPTDRTFFPVGMVSNIFEGKISSTNVDYYVLGYFRDLDYIEIAVSDSLSLLDSPSCQNEFTLSDEILLNDNLFLNNELIILDSFSLSDSASKVITSVIEVSDSLSLSESIFPIDKNIFIEDTITLVEDMIFRKGFVMLNIDSKIVTQIDVNGPISKILIINSKIS